MLDVTWEELLESIQIGAATMPERMVLPAYIDNWENGVGEGLTSIVNREVCQDSPDWIALEKKIGRAVSSDGALPSVIDRQTDEHLATLTLQAFEHFKGRLDGSIRADNISLRFLTWQFKRCPQEVCEHLMELWQHFGEANFRHILIRNVRSWNLLFQGVGRVVFDPELEKSALSGLLNIPVKKWHWEAQTACASFLVSRSKTAHHLLDEDKVSALLERVILEFKSNYRTNYHDFRYAPFLLAGLLRYRELNPQFLVFGSDAQAEEIVAMLEKTLEDIRSSSKIKHGDKQKYTYWLSDIVKFIKCEGGNPKLLMDISNNHAGSN